MFTVLVVQDVFVGLCVSFSFWDYAEITFLENSK